jgi:hypothetical protein
VPVNLPPEGQRLISNMATTLTAEPIFGRALTLAECATALGGMSLESVVGRLVLLKHINENVLCDPDTSEDERNRHILRSLNFLLDPAGVTRALADAGDDGKFRPVSDQAVLATLELAVQCCPRDGAHWINSEPQKLKLTHILLSFQSALFSSRFRERVDQVSSFEALGTEGLAEFIRNTLAHNTRFYTRNALGRLYALCCVPEVTAPVLDRTGKSVYDWFVETFGLSPEDFLSCSFMSGAPAANLNYSQPDATALFFREAAFWLNVREPERAKLRHFLGLATQTVSATPPGAPGGSIDDFIFAARSFHAHPVLELGEVSICVSPTLMMRKFIVGLPYLAQEALQRARGGPLSDCERKACRAPFGILFESYVAWLVRKLFAPCRNIEVIANVAYGPTGQTIECDLVLIRGEIAVVIELKTTMASLEFRRTGAFGSLDAMLEAGAKQVHRAAQAVRNGDARRPDGTPIKGVRWIVPCVLTYDDIPLFEPISEFYEQHLANTTGLCLFRSADGIEPVQFFDVDFLESWESELDLSPGSGAVFGYLIQRGRRGDLRYRGIRAGVSIPATSGAPQPFNEVVEASKAFLAPRAREWLRSAFPAPGSPASDPPMA